MCSVPIRPFTQGSDSMILVGPFELRTVYDSVFLWQSVDCAVAFRAIFTAFLQDALLGFALLQLLCELLPLKTESQGT